MWGGSGWKSPLAGGEAIPEELAQVVKQLESTLRYAHYGLMTATVQRPKPGTGLNGSGVAEPTLLGITVKEGQPILYSYSPRPITATNASGPSIGLERFNFSLLRPLT